MKISVYDVEFPSTNPFEGFVLATAGRKPTYRVAVRADAPVDDAVRVARAMQPSAGTFAGHVYDQVGTVTHVHDVELDPQIAA